jgi:hypothetical protein
MYKRSQKFFRLLALNQTHMIDASIAFLEQKFIQCGLNYTWHEHYMAFPQSLCVGIAF